MSDHNHPLTGEPYLGVTMYGPPRLFPRWVYRRFDWVFTQERTDERGRQYSKSRKWTTGPDHFLYKIWYKSRPPLCRLRIHDKVDIVEADASVRRAECSQCHKLVPAHKPKSADPYEVARWTRLDAQGDKLADELDAWWDSDKTGECPFCGKTGDHTLNCWEDDRTLQEWGQARVDKYVARRQSRTPHPEPDVAP